MDNLVGSNNRNSSSLQERKATKKSKTNNKKPMKVVYISNPMKFKTPACNFRALVQELTGQYAELPDPSRFMDSDNDVGGGGGDKDRGGNNHMVQHDASKIVDDHVVEVPAVDLIGKQPKTPDASPLESSFDDIFMPQMFENLSGLMPSSLLYESSANVN
ncbi:hypothetical protein P3X46_004672 [Hevea brasiliensis]|uniref:VQ domain-containing protein n=1 Tax=Hevea brasiliensis TaxID=3981 RepID=A0ABQ9N1C0_HEVBR|nr:hypothetical protein P3X46_004672 [Hevea brasiliensis]